MRRYFVEVVNRTTGIDQYLSSPSIAKIAAMAGLKDTETSFVAYMSDQWGPIGAVYEMLNVNTDEEFTFACLKLNGAHVGRTGITEGENFPTWLEKEPTFQSLYWKTRRK